MSAGNWIRLFLVIAGGIVLWRTLVALARRKITDFFCMLWGLVSLCMVLAGLLLNPTEISSYVSNAGLALTLVLFVGSLCITWYISREISALTKKNQELAMQLSLLNQEYTELRERLAKLTPPAEKEQRE